MIRAEGMGGQMKILVISLAGIGDTLLATPLIHELRRSFPGARIDVLVMWAGARDLLEANPHVTAVHFLNMLKAGLPASLKFLLGLRKERYDLSLNTYPQSKVQYRIVARLINATQRLSHRYENSTMLDRWLVTQTVPQNYHRHSVENNLFLLSLLGLKPQPSPHSTEIFLRSDELAWADQFILQHGLDRKKIVGLHVGSGKTKNLGLRRWPLENYITLIRELKGAEPDLAVILFGGPEEKEDHDTILREVVSPSVLLATSRNLRQAAALLQRCDAFLSVDTALMHLAATMKVPAQFVIETPTFNQTIEPYARPYVLIPNPKVKGRNLEFYRYDGRGIRGSAQELIECMLSVEVEPVFREMRKALVNVTR